MLAAILLVLTTLFSTSTALPPTQASADEIRNRQWQLGFLRAEDAWHYADGSGVVVAVIDSGVDAAHPDLRGQVLQGMDFVDGSTDGRSDLVGHGTTVAALIAGRGDDARGVIGLAPKAQILPIRVLDPGNGYDSAGVVAKAVRWAVDRGATIINLSLGSGDTAPVLTDALHYAFDHDVVVVSCNGNFPNDRGSQVWHPAREPGVIAVSGVTREGEFWPGSISGPETVLAAPAVEITGAQPGGDYALMQGTSFAAPLVSATAALLRSRYPRLNAWNVINRLISTAWDFGPGGVDPQYGYGIVNPARALTTRQPEVHHHPLITHDNAPGSNPTWRDQTPPGVSAAINQESTGNSKVDTMLILIGVSMVLFAVTIFLVTRAAPHANRNVGYLRD